MSSLFVTPDHPDRVRKWLPCLGCGKRMWTNRCHRICKKCRRRNNASPIRRAYHATLPLGTHLDDVAAVSSFER